MFSIVVIHFFFLSSSLVCVCFRLSVTGSSSSQYASFVYFFICLSPFKSYFLHSPTQVQSKAQINILTICLFFVCVCFIYNPICLRFFTVLSFRICNVPFVFLPAFLLVSRAIFRLISLMLIGSVLYAARVTITYEYRAYVNHYIWKEIDDGRNKWLHWHREQTSSADDKHASSLSIASPFNRLSQSMRL